ncbi:MAG: hypothetical protein MUE69_29310 [Myxococcota bacterium]|nr:hypothetical protein [Myxococcota bacterium]
MVLRSQRDAALELAWMELFDTVREPRRTRERLDAERVEHERTDRIVQRVVARVGGTCSESGDDARTRRWVAVDAEGRPVDEDARTRRWPALSDPVLEGGVRIDEVDDAACTRPWPAARPDVPVPHARTGETAPWTAARAPRRDETPRGTPLESRGRARSWVALALTAALSIAAGWLAHGWWDASSPGVPPVVASPPTR